MVDTPTQYVNGRRALLQCLDSVLAKEKNIRVFEQFFQDKIDTDPAGMFKEIVLPLMPKDGLGLTAQDDATNVGQQLVITLQPAKKGE